MSLTKVTYSMITGAPKNALDYGVDNTGATDTTAAIQAVLDTGGEIYFPEGEYLITGLTVSVAGTVMRGAGMPSVKTLSAGTIFRKTSASTSTGIKVATRDVQLFSLSVNGQAGNTGDGIAVEGARVLMQNVAVFNQGGNGIRIGTSGTTNVNSWNLANIVTDSNTGDGVLIEGNSGGVPDANAGTLLQLDTRSNGGNGITVGNAWLNTFVNILAEVNTGYGIHATSDSINNRFFGGDQDENNTAGNILNEGTGNVFVGVSDSGFTDSGTETARFTRNRAINKRIGLGMYPTGTELIAASVSQGNTDAICRFVNTGNAAADYGLSTEYELPLSGSSAVGVKTIAARSTTNESSYYAIQVKRNGESLVDTARFDSSGGAGPGTGYTRFLLYDVDTAQLQRVFVGANDSGDTGYRLLRILNS